MLRFHLSSFIRFAYNTITPRKGWGLVCLSIICNGNPTVAQNVLSLHAGYTEQSAVLVPDCEGSWVTSDFGIPVHINKAGDNFYHLSYAGDSDSLRYEAVFFHAGSLTWLDLQPIPLHAYNDDWADGATFTGHWLLRVEREADTMRIFELSKDWFQKQIQQQMLQSGFQFTDKGILLTMNTQTLTAFLSEHKNETEMTRFYGNLILQSAQKEPVKPVTTDWKVVHALQLLSCLPAFPHRDGWLGGDGDVSVQWNDTTAFWFFSDSWVCKVPNDDSCSRILGGWTMVPNSVAVCVSVKKDSCHMHYYWGNMKSDSPSALFDSHTRRYKFWINDGFRLHDHLYLLLEKIGPRPGATEDELFNFSQLGYCLLKITNPDAKPQDWKTKYIPLPEFYHPGMAVRSPVLSDSHVYFFISSFDSLQRLVRKDLNDLDNPEIPFEYFARDKKWKRPIDTNDMYDLYPGFRGTSIVYHAEIKKWIMVSDIPFMGNEIRIRTSTELTGPWSEEIPIYTIPETTPGNPKYDADNFCYLPRDCSAGFEHKPKELLLTYDINNRKIEKIRNDPERYTPRVIRLNIADALKTYSKP